MFLKRILLSISSLLVAYALWIGTSGCIDGFQDELFGGGVLGNRINLAVSGLSGTLSVTLTTDHSGASDYSITADGTYQFSDSLSEGEHYTLSFVGPTTQICALDQSSGNIGNVNITIHMYCDNTPIYVGGYINGLIRGDKVVLILNSNEEITVTNASNFLFSNPTPKNYPLDVQVKEALGYLCTVGNSDHQTHTENVTNIQVNCQAANSLFTAGINSGAMSGRTGINNKCTTAAATKSTSNNCTKTIGFISVSATDEIRDIPSLNDSFESTIPIVLSDQNKIADNWADLLDGSIDHPISIIESDYWWSGSNTDGSVKEHTCRGWTTTNANGSYGISEFSHGAWIDLTNNACYFGTDLLCLCTQAGGQLSGSVSGLSGTLVLSVNNTETMTLTADGSFYTSTLYPDSQAYSVEITTQPTGQTCTLTNASGYYESGVSSVSVTCTSNSTGGTSGSGSGGVSGTAGAGTAGAGTAGTGTAGSAGSGTAGVAGSGTAGTSGSGAAGSAGSTPTTFSIGGTVTGLTIPTLSLSLNSGAQTKAILADGAFTFDTEVNSGSSYTVSIGSEPSLMDCSVASGTGTASADVTNVTITCAGTAHFFYPTSSTVAANFGNRATSSALCDAEKDAHYSNLPCDGVVAFLSYNSSDEVWDFPTLYSLDDALELQDASNSYTKIADNWADLLDGTIDNAFSVNWWSGTLSDGSYNTGFNCSGWTSNNAMDDVGIGQSGQTSGFWAGTSEGNCAQTFKIMCLCYQE